MRHQNVSLTLVIVADCRRKQGDGTVGTKAVVSCSLMKTGTPMDKGKRLSYIDREVW